MLMELRIEIIFDRGGVIALWGGGMRGASGMLILLYVLI